MRIPLVQGRAFTDADLTTTAEPVAIIDEKFAQRFWPNGDAVGRHVWFDPARKMRIVGVVGGGQAVRPEHRRADRSSTVRPSMHSGTSSATSSNPSTIAREMVRKIHELDPTITVVDIQPMDCEDEPVDGARSGSRR